MATVKLEDAKARLDELIEALTPGEQLLIVRDGETIATLTRTAEPAGPRRPVSAVDSDYWMAPDFDTPLEEFREYME